MIVKIHSVDPLHFVLSRPGFLDRPTGGVIYFKDNSMNGFCVFAHIFEADKGEVYLVVI